MLFIGANVIVYAGVGHRARRTRHNISHYPLLQFRQRHGMDQPALTGHDKAGFAIRANRRDNRQLILPQFNDNWHAFAGQRESMRFGKPHLQPCPARENGNAVLLALARLPQAFQSGVLNRNRQPVMPCDILQDFNPGFGSERRLPLYRCIAHNFTPRSIIPPRPKASRSAPAWNRQSTCSR